MTEHEDQCDHPRAEGDVCTFQSEDFGPAGDSYAACDYPESRGDHCANFIGDSGPAATSTTQIAPAIYGELPRTGVDEGLLPIGLSLILVGAVILRKAKAL